ncbi:uncharacterized protein B0H18DRAFT_1042493 [Fomitopsis serialis]|uniref:uncharacterized protein n=1 Tax=Fomitopsis serialis TaxID=139415 RepID=UPI002008D200|nr:uncharacterized protein B0H18DRAFT_1042493 [Neoantrodia serialis]KAH9915139.1 hypothetical protein B0H18DRAFT_1042493 [Neoantrodia serialis]
MLRRRRRIQWDRRRSIRDKVAVCDAEANNRSKPLWHTVCPLTLVCSVVRRLTLEAWFETFVVHNPSELEDLRTFPEVPSWTRVVHCINPTDLWDAWWNWRIHNVIPWDFTHFARMRKLRFDLCMEDISTVVVESFTNVPPTVLELEMCYYTWPSPKHLAPMAHTFPYLQVLELRRATGWCSLCETSDVLHLYTRPPPSITFARGDGLPVPYNRVLSSMLHLRTVRMEVKCTLDGNISLQDLKLEDAVAGRMWRMQ